MIGVEEAKIKFFKAAATLEAQQQRLAAMLIGRHLVALWSQDGRAKWLAHKATVAPEMPFAYMAPEQQLEDVMKAGSRLISDSSATHQRLIRLVCVANLPHHSTCIRRRLSACAA